MLNIRLRNSRLNRLVVSLIVLVAVVSWACPTAHAQVKPFKITGGGVGPLGLPLPGQDPRPHSSVGEATHLGRYTGIGTLRTDSAAFDPATGHITGEFGSASPYVFTGADGDELVCYYGRTDFGASTPGTFELTIVDVLADGSLVVEALFVAEFVAQPDDCTGKFAGVTGSWIMVATCGDRCGRTARICSSDTGSTGAVSRASDRPLRSPLTSRRASGAVRKRGTRRKRHASSPLARSFTMRIDSGSSPASICLATFPKRINPLACWPGRPCGSRG